MHTLIWIIGKPGTGKTTAGHNLAHALHGIHFSYGELLKEVQPTPGSEGYTDADRDRVNALVIAAREKASLIVVDGNPHTRVLFGFAKNMLPYFDEVKICELMIGDDEALERLTARNRTVLTHDGASEQDRIEAYHTILAPRIREGEKEMKVVRCEVDGLSEEAVVSRMKLLLGYV